MRRAVVRTAWGVGILTVALLLVLGTALLWLWSLYLHLSGFMDPAPAAAVTGLGALVAAGVLLWSGFRTVR